MGFPHTLFGTMRDHYLLLFGTAGSIALLTGLLGAWVGARIGTWTALRRNGMADNTAMATRADVRALAEDVQALLVEVERVAEGQRFVSKLLAQPGEGATFLTPPTRTRREPGTTTPH